MDSPFQLFPEEIWCMILERVESHEEFWNLLKALPELVAIFQGHSELKRLWLFNKVIPLLMSSFGKSDLLQCHLVCKPWSEAVRMFLEGRPRVFHSDPVKNGAIHSHLDRKILGGLGFNGRTVYGRLSLMYFMSRMRDTPPERNPFPSRSLSLILGPPAFGVKQVRHFLQDVLEFLDRYGDHIWFYNLEMDLNGENVLASLSWMAQGLIHLPNLRDFRLTIKSAAGRELSQVKSLIETVQSFFPDLPCLESLQVEPAGQFANLLQRRYFIQLRKRS